MQKSEKLYIYTLQDIYIYIQMNRLAVRQKLTQHCKSTIFQLDNVCLFGLIKKCMVLFSHPVKSDSL